MTPSEFYTAQFYAWEYRGRGWYVADEPICLEAPFMPYYRHGYPKLYLDDGKRHTMVSKFVESLQGEKRPVVEVQQSLDYETIQPFQYTRNVELIALQVKLSKEGKSTPEKMKAFLVMLSYCTDPISFEIIGTGTEIVVQFVCPVSHKTTVKTYLHAFFPSYTLIPTDTFLEHILSDTLSTALVDFGLRHEFVRPLHTAKNFTLDPLIGVISSLERLIEGEQAGMQILFQPVVNQWNESILRSVTMHDGSSFFIDTPEAPEMATEKVQSPLYAVTIRTFGQAEKLEDAFGILENMTFAVIQGSKGTINELVPLPDQEYDFEKRAGDILTRESYRMGMLLNLDEVISLVHFPSETITAKKLYASTRRTKEVPAIAKGKEFILGENQHNGRHTTVTTDIGERLKHTHIIGATGTGKSTLIANVLLQDIAKGIGVVLFDPHGDLVEDVIARIPRERLDDVVLLDPSDSEYPISLNILEAHSDIEKEVLSSDLVAIFRKHATSWGDQMNTVMANAVLAILESPKGGSLHDLRRFLLEKEFRAQYLESVSDPACVYYWQKEYPLLKSTSIGPILTRLNTFLRPKAVRNMVVQKTGLDFSALLDRNKIILLKLSQGLIGIENSFLLGSLVLSKLHQAILQRQQHINRNPIFIYLDEFQNFITPSIVDMLSGIRKYRAGLILSHQDLYQLQRKDGELLNCVLGNSATRIVFRVGDTDSRRLADGLSGFDQSDLQNLGRGEAIIRIEQPQYTCSLDTIALLEVDAMQQTKNREAIVAHCRDTYATAKEHVEEVLFKSYNNGESNDTTKKNQTGKKDITPSVQTPTTPLESVFQPPTADAKHTEEVKETNVSTHRYLQTLVKKMAEARGYTATIEMPLLDGTGTVDVLLAKEGKTVAVEICNTTDPEWEMHNIAKCIGAGYTQIVSLSGDLKQLEKIKQKCRASIPDIQTYSLFFFTPDALFTFLNTSVTESTSDEATMKGYRVTVSYDDTITRQEMDRKRASVSQVILNTMRKHNKGK